MLYNAISPKLKTSQPESCVVGQGQHLLLDLLLKGETVLSVFSKPNSLHTDFIKILHDVAKSKFGCLDASPDGLRVLLLKFKRISVGTAQLVRR